MKVAIVTNDGEYVSQHFGRSRYYKIYTIEDNQIKNVELRGRARAILPGSKSKPNRIITRRKMHRGVTGSGPMPIGGMPVWLPRLAIVMF